MMTRKDYVRAIELMSTYNGNDIDIIATFLIKFFEDNNPRFDRDIFANTVVDVNRHKIMPWHMLILHGLASK